MVNVTAAVENHLADAFVLGALGDQAADRLSGVNVTAFARAAPFSTVEAEQIVTPSASLINWAYM
jgi:hypothetical protein